MNNFYVGQKVVCVDDNFTARSLDAQLAPNPHIGTVHTIKGISAHPVWGYAGLMLEGFSHFCFRATHFRPAVERGTDTGMAILRKLLTENKVDA